MHGHHALAGQDVVQKREHRLLVLAGIGGVADQDQLLLEVEGDHGFRPAAVALRVRLEARAVDDGEFGDEIVQLLARRTAQEVADEKAVPGKLGHHAHIEPVLRIRAAEKILHEVVAALHVVEHVGVEPVEIRRVHRPVVVPPDRVFHRWRAHHELVPGRAAGMHPGRDEEGAAEAEPALVAPERGLDQRRFEIVVMDLAEPRDPLLFQRLRGIHPSIRHLLAPLAARRREVGSLDIRPRKRAPDPSGPRSRRPYIMRLEDWNRTHFFC